MIGFDIDGLYHEIKHSHVGNTAANVLIVIDCDIDNILTVLTRAKVNCYARV